MLQNNSLEKPSNIFYRSWNAIGRFFTTAFEKVKPSATHFANGVLILIGIKNVTFVKRSSDRIQMVTQQQIKNEDDQKLAEIPPTQAIPPEIQSVIDAAEQSMRELNGFKNTNLSFLTRESIQKIENKLRYDCIESLRAHLDIDSWEYTILKNSPKQIAQLQQKEKIEIAEKLLEQLETYRRSFLGLMSNHSFYKLNEKIQEAISYIHPLKWNSNENFTADDSHLQQLISEMSLLKIELNAEIVRNQQEHCQQLEQQRLEIIGRANDKIREVDALLAEVLLNEEKFQKCTRSQDWLIKQRNIVDSLIKRDLSAPSDFYEIEGAIKKLSNLITTFSEIKEEEEKSIKRKSISSF